MAFREGEGTGRTLIGYCRVSTDDQNLALQQDAMARAGVGAEYVYGEHVSGAKTNRPVLAECLRALRPGDTLVVWRLDRLGRNLRELCEILDRLERRDVALCSLTESIDTATPGGRLIFHIFGALAQFERDLISERTRAGLAAARARGHRGGRKAKVDAAKLRAIEAMLADPTFTMRQAADAFSVSPAAIYRARERKRQADEAAALKAAEAAAKSTR